MDGYYFRSAEQGKGIAGRDIKRSKIFKLKRGIEMKIAKEYKGYYLDVFYKDGVVNGIIQQTQEQLQGLTVEEVVREFKKRVNLIN